ncbi:acyl-CoA dehydrogenase family protein [Rhizobium leguminosarum]|uniref:acyl-CoA dehydrogenase family protein n=1 Tax=Rhizobium leguminosarum TaxID=384 RepID=UPI0024A7FE70|nr:acyl-CoA dehydrogenase family protein [Rhizobium leguminosarum]MDI5929678.1 acyl-CoA dehydrogenase family protein [Rhizobium leguminosarum]
MMDNVEDILTSSFAKLLTEECDLRTVREVEQGRPAEKLWGAIEASGFADALLPEDRGGAGLSLQSAFPLFELCGFHAVPLPVAETLVGRALLALSSLEIPTGSITLAVAGPAQDAVRCDAVAYGAVAEHALVSNQGTVLLLETAAATKLRAEFPLDATLQWSRDITSAAPQFATADLRLVQACLAAANLSGVLQATLARTLRYANERVQFGRSIGKFQAIQQQLSVMAEEVLSARVAAQLACRGQAHELSPAAVAVAKSRTSAAAREVAAIAHAVHGAIGFTAEFDLQIFTRRLHRDRIRSGAEGHWNDVLGDQVLMWQGETVDFLREFSDVK